jgi:hypothetical protein
MTQTYFLPPTADTPNDSWVNIGHYGFRPQYRLGYTWNLTTSPAINYITNRANYVEEAIYRQTADSINDNQGIGTFLPVPGTPGTGPYEGVVDFSPESFVSRGGSIRPGSVPPQTPGQGAMAGAVPQVVGAWDAPQAVEAGTILGEFVVPGATTTTDTVGQPVAPATSPDGYCYNIAPWVTAAVLPPTSAQPLGFESVLALPDQEKIATSQPFAVGPWLTSPVFDLPPRFPQSFNRLPANYGVPSGLPPGFPLTGTVRDVGQSAPNMSVYGA